MAARSVSRGDGNDIRARGRGLEPRRYGHAARAAPSDRKSHEKLKFSLTIVDQPGPHQSGSGMSRKSAG